MSTFGQLYPQVHIPGPKGVETWSTCHVCTAEPWTFVGVSGAHYALTATLSGNFLSGIFLSSDSHGDGHGVATLVPTPTATYSTGLSGYFTVTDSGEVASYTLGSLEYHPPPFPPSPSPAAPHEVSRQQIIGLVVGLTVGLSVLVIVIKFTCRRLRRKSKDTSTPHRGFTPRIWMRQPTQRTTARDIEHVGEERRELQTVERPTEMEGKSTAGIGFWKKLWRKGAELETVEIPQELPAKVEKENRADAQLGIRPCTSELEGSNLEIRHGVE